MQLDFINIKENNKVYYFNKLKIMSYKKIQADKNCDRISYKMDTKTQICGVLLYIQKLRLFIRASIKQNKVCKILKKKQNVKIFS